MPTLNSIFPFLEAVRPESDPCWHIRRGRLLHHYRPIWAVFRHDSTQLTLVTFDYEPRFTEIGAMADSRFVLCLVPNLWHVPSWKDPGFAGFERLRNLCSDLVSTKAPGKIFEQSDFWERSDE